MVIFKLVVGGRTFEKKNAHACTTHPARPSKGSRLRTPGGGGGKRDERAEIEKHRYYVGMREARRRKGERTSSHVGTRSVVFGWSHNPGSSLFSALIPVPVPIIYQYRYRYMTGYINQDHHSLSNQNDLFCCWKGVGGMVTSPPPLQNPVSAPVPAYFKSHHMKKNLMTPQYAIAYCGSHHHPPCLPFQHMHSENGLG